MGTVIKLTEHRSISGSIITKLVLSPFDRTIRKLRKAAIDKAGRHYIERHKWVLTVRTLPDEILKALPTSEKLYLREEEDGAYTGHEEVHLEGAWPSLHKLTRCSYNDTPLVSVGEALDSMPEALAEYKAVDPMEHRRGELEGRLGEYLADAGFTTVGQLHWSAPALASTLLKIHPVREKSYGRRNDTTEIFLARLSDRRYTTGIRRPRRVHKLPKSLHPLLGEAKLLATALEKS